MQYPFFTRPIPKIMGREGFGIDLVKELMNKARSMNINNYDLVTTVTHWTALSIVNSYKQIETQVGGYIHEAIISGGGANNKTLMHYLKGSLSNTVLKTSEDVGIDSEFKEAIAFAILGNKCLHGIYNNLPSVTGANRRVIMGKVSFTQKKAYEKLKISFQY